MVAAPQVSGRHRKKQGLEVNAKLEADAECSALQALKTKP